ncbi:UAA transporter [Kalmanozyma brasiliensis GHG001]|uniref:UDP-N-acetylglucosamine transporter n=1 Tax=Kalmanozyma brasiliensis (strain GHG001) TaxID=1365824 RepID=V5EX10_KALBG|nr:UAA transporter [Kalmanozyma brasiliensis GHG001]EST10180.1 UAA transporter [Kalmanozyma brasiliensis GHG001]
MSSTAPSIRQRKSPTSTSNGAAPKDATSTAGAILATTAPEWILILSLIFGGCCSNAFTLELATRQLPSAGTLITFAQFLVTTLSGLPYFLRFSSSFPWIGLRPRAVPLYRWVVQVAFYLTTSLLNNMAFAYDVPMPVHIVFRSGGLVVNMILGWLVQRRRYSPLQIFSVALVTAGVVSSTMYTAHPASKSQADAGEYATGVLLLFAALVLTGFMGLWQEATFREYGNQNWRESMFYSHLLSLPMFGLRRNNLLADIRLANSTTPWWFGFDPPLDSAPKSIFSILTRGLRKDTTPTKIFTLPPSLRPHLPSGGVWIPSFYPPLLLNVATQLLCINGVNRLTSKVSSLSVTLVLVLRKAVSLMVSVMLVQGDGGSTGLWVGAGAVLVGTVGYSLSGNAKVRPKEKRDKAQ